MHGEGFQHDVHVCAQNVCVAMFECTCAVERSKHIIVFLIIVLLHVFEAEILSSVYVYLLLDKAIGMIEKACTECGYILLVTADHGNAETMIDKDGKPVTKHTTNKGIVSVYYILYLPLPPSSPVYERQCTLSSSCSSLLHVKFLLFQEV